LIHLVGRTQPATGRKQDGNSPKPNVTSPNHQSQLPQPIDEQHINTPYLCTSSATFKSRIILHPSDRSAQGHIFTRHL
jgi:hypothetical protein